MTIRDTSIAAYDRIDLQRREREVLDFIKQRYPRPARFTRQDISDAIGWPINRITGRVLRLIEKGMLVELEERRDGKHLLELPAVQLELEIAA